MDFKKALQMTLATAVTAVLFGAGPLVMRAQAASSSSSVAVTAAIGTIFTLSVSGGPVSLSPAAGTSSSANITSAVTSNRKGVQWGLRTACSAAADATLDTTNCLHDASIPDVVPNANFSYSTTVPAFGGTATNGNFSTTTTTFYTSPANGKTPAVGQAFTTAFTVNNTSGNFSAGSYTTTVTVTLTDTGF